MLENDPIAVEIFGNDEIDRIVNKYRKFHPNMERDIMVTRAGYAVVLERKVVEISPSKGGKFDWLDRFIINNPMGGILFSILIFGLIFSVLFYLGGWFQDTLGEIFNSLFSR